MTSLEQQLVKLKELGISPRPDVHLVEVLRDAKAYQDEYELDPYTALMCALGNDIHMFSYDIWHFDAECVEGNGSYVDIAKRMVWLTGGLILLTEIQDYVDLEGKVAWISFKINGQTYHWDLKVDDDWVDPAFFTHFVALNALLSPSKSYAQLILGQDALIVYRTPEAIKRLNQETQLKFHWLT